MLPSPHSLCSLQLAPADKRHAVLVRSHLALSRILPSLLSLAAGPFLRGEKPALASDHRFVIPFGVVYVPDNCSKIATMVL